jgi:acyl carrier protein
VVVVPEVEVFKRTLRVKDRGPDARVAPAAVAEAAPVETADRVGAAPVAATSEPAVVDPVQEKVMAIIAEKSGYPTDMLDLELDLEADLGIDTVKQAEMFAAIREAYDIPRDDNLKLRDFPTLAHTVQFVYDKRPDLQKPTATAPAPVASAPAAETVAPTAAAPAAAPSGDGVKETVLRIVSEQTGYPIDMLDLDLDLEADLGIDTVKQAETFAAIREAYDIPRDENLKLRDFPTLGHTMQFVYDRRPDLQQAAASAPAMPETVAAEAPAAAVDEPVRQKVLEVISEQTGYPVDMLDPELDLEADLGIDTVKQAEVFATSRRWSTRSSSSTTNGPT